jgi:transcriptional regulator with XRE-family HTH domain
MDANQVIAYNLRKARESLKWTQEQAARELEPYIGVRWSSASFSVAERSADEGARKREFDAKELLAFAHVFRHPIGWFFQPPDDVEFVDCGDGEHTRALRRVEVLEAAGETEGPGVRDFQVGAALRNVAALIERGGEAALLELQTLGKKEAKSG